MTQRERAPLSGAVAWALLLSLCGAVVVCAAGVVAHPYAIIALGGCFVIMGVIMSPLAWILLRRRREWAFMLTYGIATLAMAVVLFFRIGPLVYLLGGPACILLGALVARALSRPIPMHGCCPNCDYNLTGNVSGICPECGTAVPAEASHHGEQPRRRVP
jgi:hypothetical protein